MKNSVISGVELRNTDSQAENIRQAGLEVAYHNPGGILNLADPSFMSALEDPQTLEAIRASECPVVTFHCAYSATRITKKDRVQQMQVTGEPITNREELLRIMVRSLCYAKEKINDGLAEEKSLLIAIENLPWHREDAPIERMDHSPPNVGKQFVTESDYIKDLLDELDETNILFLHDVSHGVITEDARGDGYVDELLWIGRGRTADLHINRPRGKPGRNGKDAYTDSHMPLTDGDAVSESILKYAARVIDMNPDIYFTTLEVYTDTDNDPKPVNHARIMVEQAGLYKKKLNL